MTDLTNLFVAGFSIVCVGIGAFCGWFLFKRTGAENEREQVTEINSLKNTSQKLQEECQRQSMLLAVANEKQLSAEVNMADMQCKYEQILTAKEALDTQLQDVKVKTSVLESKNESLAAEKQSLLASIENDRKKIQALEQAAIEKAEECSEARTSLLAEKEKVTVLQNTLSIEVQERKKLSAMVQEKDIELNRTTEKLQARQEALTETVNNFEKSKESLKSEFHQLAQGILESRGKEMVASNTQSISALLNPFKQQLDGFQKRVDSLHSEGSKQQGELKSELHQMQKMHGEMANEASRLAKALKNEKKVQGNWGEMVLENVLDRSGLVLGADYSREVTLNSIEHQRYRPDVIVNLPEGRHIVVDSKVSLVAYTDYVNADNEFEAATALQLHVKAVGQRIKELAAKEYGKLNGINSPDMVILFMPIESAFVEALKADESLFQQALENHVLVATPTTLLASLNIVKQLWRFENQNKHTAELANKAELVFKKLKSFLESFQNIKIGLQKASDSYEKAESQLLSGRGNLVNQVNSFKELAPQIRAELPEQYAQRAGLELQAQDRLKRVSEA